MAIATAQPVTDNAQGNALGAQALKHAPHRLARLQHLVDTLATDLVDRLVHQQFGRALCGTATASRQPEPRHQAAAAM